MVHNFFWHVLALISFCVMMFLFMLVKNMELIKWASLSKIPDVQKVENVPFLGGAESKL